MCAGSALLLCTSSFMDVVTAVTRRLTVTFEESGDVVNALPAIERVTKAVMASLNQLSIEPAKDRTMDPLEQLRNDSATNKRNRGGRGRGCRGCGRGRGRD